jgi:Tol biopolymer transport system component
LCFTADGNATGPDPGTFHEDGTIVIVGGHVTRADAQFTIQSASGNVSGTKHFDANADPTRNTGSCTHEPSDRDPGNFLNFSSQQPQTYQATITTAQGRFSDSGTCFSTFQTQFQAVNIIPLTAFTEDFQVSKGVVFSAALVSIAVTPADSILAMNLTRQFTAIGSYSDGSTEIITSLVTWSSSDITVATMSPTTPGLAQSVGLGDTNISATLGSMFGSTVLTVGVRAPKIAFTSTRDGRPQIYVMSPGGSGQLRLTKNPGIDTTPSWSPDGKKIAFSRAIGSPTGLIGTPQISTMNADGTGASQLTSAGENTTPAWSPDGTKIAFTSTRDGRPQIYVMSPDGSGQLRLTKNLGIDTTPSWSPDGKKIAFSRAIGSPTGIPQISTMNADGTGASQLTSAGENTTPAWSPDGTKIAFSSTRDGHPQIYAMSPDGSGQIRLTKNPGIDTSPSWSPDGKKIAFSRAIGGPPGPIGTPQISTMNADGTGARRLTNAGQNTTPAWASH